MSDDHPSPTPQLGSAGNARAIDWRPSPAMPRIYFKDLAAAAGWTMRLLRYEPGGAQPPVAQDAPRFLYVLEGELIHAGQRLWPGAALAIPPGAASESYSEVGCTVLLLSAGRE